MCYNYELYLYSTALFLITNMGRVADPVIKANARRNLKTALGQESSLEAAGTLVAAAPSPGSILHHPGGAGWSWGRCGCHKDSCQTKLQFCQVPHMGGIKLQLLCGIRIELALVALLYLARILSKSLPVPSWGT